MKLITFHHRNVHVSYKNTVCSFASLFYIAITLLTIIIPIYLVLQLSPRVQLENSMIWEQPSVQFKYQYNFMGLLRTEHKAVACSSFPYQRFLIDDAKERSAAIECSSIKVSEEDWNHDGRFDEISFQIRAPGEMKRFSLQLFFDLQLRKFCVFNNIPTVFLFDIESPASQMISQNTFHAELKLHQKISFSCPLFFRHQETHFQSLNLSSHSSEDYTSQSIFNRVERNPGYFYFETVKSFQDHSIDPNTFKFSLKIPELMIRFETPIWTKVLHVWVRYLSLYLLFFLAAKKFKDFIYGNYWIRCWEVIPWKKIY